MRIRIILEESIGFRIENGFIVIYKGMQKLFKVSNNANNRKSIIDFLRG